MVYPRLQRAVDSPLVSTSTAPTLFALVLAIALLVPAIQPLYRTSMSLMMVDVVFVVGLWVFVGNSGIISFGHVAFMGVGAYVTAILTIPALTKQILFPGMPGLELAPALAVPAGGAIAAAVATVVGIPLMRLSGLVASLGTFALLNIAHNLAANLDRVTGGSTGVSGVPQLQGEWSLAAWVAVALAVAWGYGQTACALRLRASREDPIAASALGIRVGHERLGAFVLSAFIGGVAGGLYALQSGSFVPASFFLVPTFLAVAMLVVGGRLTLSGAVLGVLVLTLLRELLATLEASVGVPGLQNVGLSLAMLLTLLLRPAGLVGDRELVMGRSRLGSPTHISVNGAAS